MSDCGPCKIVGTAVRVERDPVLGGASRAGQDDSSHEEQSAAEFTPLGTAALVSR